MTLSAEKNQNAELKCRVLGNNLKQATSKNHMLVKEKEALLKTESTDETHEQANKISKLYDEQIDFLHKQLEK